MKTAKQRIWKKTTRNVYNQLVLLVQEKARYHYAMAIVS